MRFLEKNIQRGSFICIVACVSVVIRKVRFMWITWKIKIKSLSISCHFEILVNFFYGFVSVEIGTFLCCVVSLDL